MVLLRVLHELSRANNWKLAVAHLNHRLRGASSNADERLVRRTAHRLGLPVVIERADIRALMKEHRLSLEMAARKARHEFLARTAARLHTRTVALAHHADDQVELFFLRLLRGSGGQGLAGMKLRNPSPANGRVELVRPLLEIPKEALHLYAAEHKVRYREDATNACVNILRNRIRHELIPLLRRDFQAALGQVVRRTIEVVGAESEYVEEVARTVVRRLCSQTKEPSAGEAFHSVPFEELPVSVQRRVLQIQVLDWGVVPGYELIETLRRNQGKSVSATRAADGGSVLLVRDSIGSIGVRQPAPTFSKTDSLVVDLGRENGSACFGGVSLRWRAEDAVRFHHPKHLTGSELFDADRVGAGAILRHWQPGDRFQPIGMPSAVKVQDFLTNQKIPRARRHELVVATTAQGEIFWIEGMRISDRFKLTKRTIRRLCWVWKRV
jgi:tRNA(Ile)-lysidine synthase